ncbi:cystathionine beta-lyase [Novosphingobium mangrovi (ex Huang et al. 2023)]|uniref:Cystathionine beta-lyase n=1 Tax=Novosphingobium mangrovi (ex Huang et al. 2023) TaxID=2976432 RepID=A0ABT2I294_9SPHN|nr:cystathionine beta-lyase [Novosphingobium mangrovi (ex Huang et al. 2023)]MCT2398927.1 cystathionine beta-lyase [Novosphingobium mangrovi (ex Huang et al. 2023)]
MSDTSKLEDVAPGTLVVGAGRRKEWTGPVVNPPIWRASTHLYESTAALAEGPRRNEDGHFFYGRRGAPTQWALSDALTQLEPGAAGTVLYPSGVAAIAGVLLTVLRPGDVVLISDNAYDPTRTMGRGLLSDFGIEPRFFDPLDISGYEALFCERTRAVLLEAPGSLSMEVCDLPELARIARARGAISVLDNTWAGPLGFHALEKGIDITLMALTKHVGGHSDLMMGSASAGAEFYTRLRQRAQQLGTVVSPDDAALALRGLRTLHLRLKQETESALKIAQWLSQRGEVAQVLCPMLPGSPGHGLWQRDFTGGCGLFSFVFKGGDAAARNRFVDALELFGIGFSWGGYESLALPIDPATYRSCMAWPPEPSTDESRFGVRLAIGLEDADDLIADIEQALAAWNAG